MAFFLKQKMVQRKAIPCGSTSVFFIYAQCCKLPYIQNISTCGTKDRTCLLTHELGTTFHIRLKLYSTQLQKAVLKCVFLEFNIKNCFTAQRNHNSLLVKNCEICLDDY